MTAFGDKYRKKVDTTISPTKVEEISFGAKYRQRKLEPEPITMEVPLITGDMPFPKAVPRKQYKRPIGPFYPEGKEYDYVTAELYGLKPDETGHWPSRVPKTGLILKGKKHPTWDLTIEEEKKLGNKIIKKEGRYYSQPIVPLTAEEQKLRDKELLEKRPPSILVTLTEDLKGLKVIDTGEIKPRETLQPHEKEVYSELLRRKARPELKPEVERPGIFGTIKNILAKTGTQIGLGIWSTILGITEPEELTVEQKSEKVIREHYGDKRFEEIKGTPEYEKALKQYKNIFDKFSWMGELGKKFEDSLKKFVLTPVSDIAKEKIIPHFEEKEAELAAPLWDDKPGLTNWREWADTIVGGGLSMLQAIGITIVTKSTSAGAGWLSVMESSGEYRAARKAGKSPNEARKIFVKSGTGTFLLEKLGLDFLFSRMGVGGGTIMHRLLVGGQVGLVETAQEELQTIWQNLIAKHGYDEARDIFEGMFETAVGVLPVSVIAGFLAPGVPIAIQRNNLIRDLEKKGDLSKEEAGITADIMIEKAKEEKEKTEEELKREKPPIAKPEVKLIEVKKPIPKELEPLAEEARKYKSAEEFEKAAIEGTYKTERDLYEAFIKLGARLGIPAAKAESETLTPVRQAGFKDLKDFYTQATKEVKPKPIPVKPKAVKKPVKPKPIKPKEPIAKKVRVVPTIKKSRLGIGIKKRAIREKLIYGFDKRFRDLPEYEKIDVREQAEKAVEFTLNNQDEAIEIAMGRKSPPAGILPESIFKVVEDLAMDSKNIDLIKELATMSTLVSEATIMGQRIRMLGERERDSAVNLIREVKKEREKAAEKKRGKRSETKTKDRMQSQIERRIQRAKPSRYSWIQLMNEIKC